MNVVVIGYHGIVRSAHKRGAFVEEAGWRHGEARAARNDETQLASACSGAEAPKVVSESDRIVVENATIVIAF